MCVETEEDRAHVVLLSLVLHLCVVLTGCSECVCVECVCVQIVLHLCDVLSRCSKCVCCVCAD